MISRIIESFGGTLKIISRKGSLTLKDGRILDKTLFKENLWRGSIVIVRLKYDKFFDITLEDFLKVIRKEDREREEEDIF